MNLREQIESYVPFDETEEKIKKYLLNWINTFNDVLTRENEFGHFASSAFVVNKDRTKMLVVYHNIYDAWIFPGGHADGEENLLIRFLYYRLIFAKVQKVIRRMPDSQYIQLYHFYLRSL